MLKNEKSIIFAGFAALNLLGAQAQAYQSPPPEIVSAWKYDAGNVVIIFRNDGFFNFIDGDVAHPGMESGTFEWNSATSAFTATVVVDTNGDAGFSHPLGSTTMTVSGNTLTYHVTGEGSYTCSRIVNTPTAIVGSWYIPGHSANLTFLSDGTYYHSERSNDAPDGYDGMERGTYTWDSGSGVFTATPIIDTNGHTGLSDQAPTVDISVTGNTMTLLDGTTPYTLIRITTNATPINLPAFGMTRFMNYVQTADGAPALRSSDPYSADAFVNTEVNATVPKVKIGSGSEIDLEIDGGGFSIEWGFPLSTDLNNFLPVSTTVAFKSGADIANLATGSSSTFPTPPQIIARGGGAWSGGIYQFSEDEVLQWTLPSGFNAADHLTIIAVYDPVLMEDVVFAALQGEVTHFDLSGKLDPSKEYEIKLEFYRIDSSNTAGGGVFSGKQGHLFSASSTMFMAQSVAVPAPTISTQPAVSTVSYGAPLVFSVGINGAAIPTATFQWYKNSQEIIGQTGSSLTIGSFEEGANGGLYHVVITNSAGSIESNSFTVGSYGAWQFSAFDPTELEDPAISGNEADPDGDGVQNVYEFLFGGDPLTVNSSLLPTLTTTPITGGQDLVFKYKRKLAASGVLQVIKHSTDLSTGWEDAVHGVNGVTISTTPVDVATEEVTVTIPSTTTGRFVQLNASR